jgi:hypothetical protein
MLRLGDMISPKTIGIIGIKSYEIIYIYNIFGYIWKNTHPLTSITQLWVPSGYPGF